MAMRQLAAVIAALRTMPRSMRRRPVLSLVQLLLAIALFPAGFSVISFHAALTPAQAGDQAMDPAWEAGVMNHGRYYQWYLIDHHPVWYWSSMAVVIAAVAVAFHALSGSDTPTPTPTPQPPP